MPSSTTKMPTTKAIISAAASAAATGMVIRSMAREFVPMDVSNYLYSKVKTLLFSSDLTLVIEEYDSLYPNRLFKAAETYLEPKIPPNTQRLKLSMPNKGGKVSVSLEQNQEITDSFKGVSLKWKFISKEGKAKHITKTDDYDPTPVYEHRWFELSFHKKHKNLVIDSYINHFVKKSQEMNQKTRTLKLHTLGMDRVSWRGGWVPVYLDHPANFDTIAMDYDVKKMIMEDLDRFVKRKDFYRRVGKAWKRGYLLFGPPGTGKSSLIAAMANYLKFDIYDLELTAIKTNSDLRKLLISTANKSILVVEDIDCSIELQDRINEAKPSKSTQDIGNQVTLSGLLNFMDGLWSSIGDERIIVFTTNHIEKLDPALLRPGRMDVHINMSYCSPRGFNTLAFNYLGITQHPLFVEIEELLKKTKVTPAEVAEQLMRSEDAEVALKGMVDLLQLKKREQDDMANKEDESAIAAAEAKEEDFADAIK